MKLNEAIKLLEKITGMKVTLTENTENPEWETSAHNGRKIDPALEAVEVFLKRVFPDFEVDHMGDYVEVYDYKFSTGNGGNAHIYSNPQGGFDIAHFEGNDGDTTDGGTDHVQTMEQIVPILERNIGIQ